MSRNSPLPGGAYHGCYAMQSLSNCAAEEVKFPRASICVSLGNGHGTDECVGLGIADRFVVTRPTTKPVPWFKFPLFTFS